MTLRPYRRDQYARVLGDIADWRHSFDAGQAVRVTLMVRNPGPGWNCRVDETGAEWQVAEEDLELITDDPREGKVIIPGVVREISSTGGQKEAKIHRFDQIPTGPLRKLAARYGSGNAKYPVPAGDIDNWRKGYAWSLSYAAMQRHATSFWAGEEIDPDTGEEHLTAVAWHAFALLEWCANPKLRELFDDRQDGQN